MSTVEYNFEMNGVSVSRRVAPATSEDTLPPVGPLCIGLAKCASSRGLRCGRWRAK